MNIAGLLFLLVAHYLAGRGVLRSFKVTLSPVPAFCAAMITGVGLIAFVPCLLQLFGIPITILSSCIGVSVFVALLCISLMRSRARITIPSLKLPALYEWPFIIVILLLALVSVWRCFYYPPSPRDMLSGPELIAEYAVREGTMINSVFTIDLQTTNNHFKSPFITGLQILYKLLVNEFGQQWLSVIFLSFIAWLYVLLRRWVHPIIAGMLLLFFVATPDLFAYSYLMLYDYSNMVYFFFGFYFLKCYLLDRNQPDLLFSAFLVGLATYVRNETLVLVGLLLPLLLFHLFRQKVSQAQLLKRACAFILIPALFYCVCMYLFIRNFVPVAFDVSGQLNHNLLQVSVFFKRFWDMHVLLIFKPIGLSVYGVFIYFFMGLLLVDLIWPRNFNKESRIILYGIAVVYFGMPLLGYLFPLFDLFNTTKRGLFKVLPLMLIYMANSGLIQRLSDYIRKWEYAKVDVVTEEVTD